MAPSPSPTPAPTHRTLIGVTLDDPWETGSITAKAAKLPGKLDYRVVFDEGVQAKEYKYVVEALKPHTGFLMGELLDSYFVKDCSQSCYEKRAADYIFSLPLVDVWEVGNEINGDPGPDDWLGKDAWKKAAAALRMAKQAGKKTAVTFYLTPRQDLYRWIGANLSTEERGMIDYVLVSYYEKDNGEWQPDWQAVFDRLGDLFPTAWLAVGEMGDDRSKAKGRASFDKYYRKLNVKHPRFVLGNFLWYQNQLFGKDPFLFDELKDVMKNQGDNR
jgi:hypothetical protein